MEIIKVIQRVQSAYSKGVQSDDSRLTNRHIYNALVTNRQRLIVQQARKRQKLSDWNFIVLPCVELIEVPAHECSCLMELGCRVYRTKYPLPKVLTDLNRHIISWVFTIDNSMKIEEASREEILYIKGNKYTSGKQKYVLENSHLYFPVRGGTPGVVKVKLLAEDPVEAYNYPSMCGDCVDCEDCEAIVDKEFPIDGELLQTVIEMTAEELIGIFWKGQEDQTNNTADSKKEESK